MIFRHIIFTVAKVEAKTLFRSWFFRVFAVLILSVLTLLNVVLFTLPTSSWMNRGMGASIPYTNILLLNIAQAIIAVFLASEFLKFDRKLDTTESVYPRSMTNTGYVLGKTFGVLSVFLGLNLVVLILSFIFNVFFTEVRIIPALYLYYPLLLSIPALLFMFGLSFLAMVIIRNQATTFLLLLGWTAAALLFLGGRWHGIFDFMGLHIPLMYSDFIGFGNLRTVLLQRGMYFLLGIGCILSTALLLGRLIQSRTVRIATIFFAVLSFGGGILCGGAYLHHFTGGEKLRAEIRELNRTLASEPAVTVTAGDLSVTHDGKTVEIEAQITFTNGTDAPLDGYRFSLNPGFGVTRATRGEETLPVERKLHTITVKPKEPLAPGAEDTLTLTYRGAPDERACYADLDERDRRQNLRYWVFSVDRRYGIVSPGYVILTEEDLWYPVAGVPYGSAFPILGKRDFVRFSLQVKTSPKLTA
ncbi:MAG: ABC transporter permease, partial [Candidatus Latescibacterota bacterium]